MIYMCYIVLVIWTLLCPQSNSMGETRDDSMGSEENVRKVR